MQLPALTGPLSLACTCACVALVLRALACVRSCVRASGACVQDASLEHYSGYTASDLKDTVRALQKVLLAAHDSKEQAVRRKFAASKYWRVSQLQELDRFCEARRSAV